MYKQKNDPKSTALNKKRINLFKLKQRVICIERAIEQLINATETQVEIYKINEITKEEILERLNELERIVLPQQKQGCVRRLLTRFWDMLGR